MTVKELIDKLSEVNQELEVLTYSEHPSGDFGSYRNVRLTTEDVPIDNTQQHYSENEARRYALVLN